MYVCVCGCVFTVASWGVGPPYVLSELKGPAVILPERNMEWDNGKDPSTPPKDKGDRDKRLKPYNQLTIYNGQAPVASRIRGIGEGLSQSQPVQAINSTLLSTQLISLSSSSSKIRERRRGLMPKPRLKGEAVRTSQRIALSRCSLTKKREHWGLVMRKRKLCKRTESNTENPSLCYRLWLAFATDSD